MGSRKERILQKVNPVFLKMTPRLSGDAGSFIDLDSEDSLEDGAIKLMTRFFKNQDLCEKNKQNPVQVDSEVIISSAKYNENGEISDLITERLNLPFVKNKENAAFDRPGIKLQELKRELQEKMSAKWEEEYKKRISEIENSKKKHKKNKKCHEQSGSDESEGTEDEEDADTKLEEEKNIDCGDEGDNEGVEEQLNKSNNVSVCDGEENSQFTSHNDSKKKSEEDLENDDSQYYTSLVPPYQPGGGLLYGGSELSQTDEGLPQYLLSPYLNLSHDEPPGSNMQSQSFDEKTTNEISNENEGSPAIEKPKLFSQNSNTSYDLSDAFEFCSGKFPDADQAQTESLKEGNSDAECEEKEEGFADGENEDDFVEEESEDEENEVDEKYEEDEEDEEDECDEDENSTEERCGKSEGVKSSDKIKRSRVAFEDSEEEEVGGKGEEEEEEKEAERDTENEEQGTESKEILKLLREDEDEEEADLSEFQRKKSRRNLHFSDEEDSGEENEKEAKGEDENGEKGKDEESENEEEGEELDNKSVNYDSEENEILNPKEFFEKEAELSGSEWSGDEDERGLDEFDLEEGDADNIDDDVVRSQLEKIHLRRVLDDDARQVRLIQEILFEDGDLHSDGEGRERKFKWKNLGTFKDLGNDGEAKEEGGNSSEDDCAEEEEQRKLRYEKELFLMTKKKVGPVASGIVLRTALGASTPQHGKGSSSQSSRCLLLQDGECSSDEELISDVQVVKIERIKAPGTTASKPGNPKTNDNLAKIPNSSFLSATVWWNTCCASELEVSLEKSVVAVGKKMLIHFQHVRGSFLTRNEEFLSRLAKATSAVSDNVSGPKHSRNFVFATMSPEKVIPERNTTCKRQVEEAESWGRQEKRMKALPPQVDSRPSILDLLF